MTDYFKTHFFIEMFFGKENNRGLLLHEQTLPYNKVRLLFEEYGLFKGCDHLAQIIITQLSTIDGYVGETFDMNIGNWFIDNVHIIIVKEDGCFYDSTSVINNNGCFEPLVFYVGFRALESPNLKSMIMHELTHAYEDWNRRKNGVDSLYAIADKNGYDKNPIGLNNIYDEDIRKLSWILYHYNDFERNAYFAQINGEMSKCNIRFERISDAYNWLKQNSIAYRNYRIIFDWVSELISIRDVNRQNNILKRCKELSNFQFKTYNQLCKWLQLKTNNYQRSFNRIIPKIVGKYMRFEEWLNPSNVNLME